MACRPRYFVALFTFGTVVGAHAGSKFFPPEHETHPSLWVEAVSERPVPSNSTIASKMGYLVAHFPDGTHSVATGAKIGPGLIATAAHNIIPGDGSVGAIATKIYYWPYGRPFDWNRIPAEGFVASEVFVHRHASTVAWPSRGLPLPQREIDYAFIRVNPQRGQEFGNQWFSLRAATSHEGDQFEAIAYSIPLAKGDKHRGRLVEQTCTVWAITKGVFVPESECVGSSGRSGGPLTEKIAGSLEGQVVRGFFSTHTVGKYRTAIFSRLTPDVVATVENRIKKGETRAEFIQPFVKIRIDGSGRTQ